MLPTYYSGFIVDQDSSLVCTFIAFKYIYLSIQHFWRALLYLQYFVPHSKWSLQLAPTGFMLFQRHNSDRLVRWISPFQPLDRGSVVTCKGKNNIIQEIMMIFMTYYSDKIHNYNPIKKTKTKWLLTYLSVTYQKQKNRKNNKFFLKSLHVVCRSSSRQTLFCRCPVLCPLY